MKVQKTKLIHGMHMVFVVAMAAFACNPLSADDMCPEGDPCCGCPKNWTCNAAATACEPPTGFGGGGGNQGDCRQAGCANGLECAQQNDGSYQCTQPQSPQDCQSTGCPNGQSCEPQFDGSYQCVQATQGQSCDEYGDCPAGQSCDWDTWICQTPG